MLTQRTGPSVQPARGLCVRQTLRVLAREARELLARQKIRPIRYAYGRFLCLFAKIRSRVLFQQFTAAQLQSQFTLSLQASPADGSSASLARSLVP